MPRGNRAVHVERPTGGEGSRLARCAARALAAALLALVSACGPSGPAGAAACPASPGHAADSLRFALEVPAEAVVGQAVPVRITVRNGTGHPVAFNVADPHPVNVVVSRPDGTAVWALLADSSLAQMMEVGETIPAGGMRTFTRRWDQRTRGGRRAGPGTYCVSALLYADTPPGTVRLGPEQLVVR